MQESGRIIYYPVKHWPSYEELERLKQLQIEINAAKLQILVEERFDKYNAALRSQMLANRLRDSWTLIKNEKETTHRMVGDL